MSGINKSKGTQKKKSEEKTSSEKTHIKKLEEQINALEEQLKRAIADYRNLENRVEEERKKTILYANKDLVLKLLPAFDSIFLAARYTSDEGVKLTVRHMVDVLSEEGIEKIETQDKEFNPQLMECIDIVEGSGSNKVIEELSPGFMLNGALLRPARVKVEK